MADDIEDEEDGYEDGEAAVVVLPELFGGRVDLGEAGHVDLLDERYADDDAADYAETPPDVRQQRPFTCGPAALRAAIHTLTGTDVEESALSDELSTSKQYGTSPDKITEVAEEHGLRVRQQSLCGISDLRRWTAGNGIVLTPIQLHNGGHWVAVYRVDAEGVHFQDPIEGDSTLPIQQWNRGWIDTATGGGTRYYIRHGVFLSRR